MSDMFHTVGYWHYLESWTGCRLMMRPQVKAASAMNPGAQRFEMALWLSSPLRPGSAVIVKRIELRSYVPYIDDTEIDELLEAVVPFLQLRMDLVPRHSQLYQQTYPDYETRGLPTIEEPPAETD